MCCTPGHYGHPGVPGDTTLIFSSMSYEEFEYKMHNPKIQSAYPKGTVEVEQGICKLNIQPYNPNFVLWINPK